MIDSDRAKGPRRSSVKLPPEELGFLRQLARDLGVRSVTEAARQLSASARTLFGVPQYMVPELRLDIARRGLTLLTYVQELLAHRYQELATKRSSDAGNDP